MKTERSLLSCVWNTLFFVGLTWSAYDTLENFVGCVAPTLGFCSGPQHTIQIPASLHHLDQWDLTLSEQGEDIMEA
jgi:hypothetical protein